MSFTAFYFCNTGFWNLESSQHIAERTVEIRSPILQFSNTLIWLSWQKWRKSSQKSQVGLKWVCKMPGLSNFMLTICTDQIFEAWLWE